MTTFSDIRAALLAREEIALIDAREEGPFAEAHPLFAASLPLGRLELEVFYRIPRLTTRIVVCDAGEGVAELARTRLLRIGYRDVTVLDGGIQGWEASGGELFRDVNVPSKAFGELVESKRHTPSLTAEQVHALIQEQADLVILDARPFDEYMTMSIPTATSVPGGELVYRVAGMARHPATLVIVNCAGRTRSIIGAQSLVNAGIPNRVAALRNGTIGWTLAGFELQHGQQRSGAVADPEAVSSARRRARTVADCAGVRRADAAQWQRWRDDHTRTTYAFDVRTRAEFECSHPAGFRHAPGGQLVQETDVFAPVRGARIVLWDSATVRADMTASWLAQMGWDVSVLDDIGGEVLQEQGPDSRRRVPVPACLEINVQEARLLLGEEDAVAVDVSPSRDYLAGHVDGAWLVSRNRLTESVRELPPAGTYVVISTDGFLAAHTAADLMAASGVRTLVLTGGTVAWRDSGLPLRTGPERLTVTPADVYKRPYEGTDNAASAMQAYLDWEFGLVEQLARDGTHGFDVLEFQER